MTHCKRNFILSFLFLLAPLLAPARSLVPGWTDPYNPPFYEYIECCGEGGGGGPCGLSLVHIPFYEFDIGKTPFAQGTDISLKSSESKPSPEFFMPSALDISMSLGVPGNVSAEMTGPNGGRLTYNNGCSREVVTIYEPNGPIEDPKCPEGMVLTSIHIAMPSPPPSSSSSSSGGSSSSSAASSSSATPAYAIIQKPTGAAAFYDMNTGNLKAYGTTQGKIYHMEDLPGSERLTIIRNEDGVIRQVRTASGLADIQLLSDEGRGYEIKYYPVSQVGGKDSSGRYTFTGTPLRSLKVENPQWQQQQYNQVVLTETEGSNVKVNSYSYTDTNRGWEKTLPDGTKISMWETAPTTGVPETVANVPPATNVSLQHFIRTRERRDAAGTFLGRVRSVMWVTERGEAKVLQETKDFGDGGLNATTTYEYHMDTANTKVYSKLKSVKNANESWEYKTWDAMGRLSKIYSGWLDTPMPGGVPVSEEGCRVTEYLYVPLDSNDQLALNDQRPRTGIERINGIETSRRYSVYASQSNGEFQEIEERAAAQGAAYGAAGNLRTITTYYSESADAASKGRIKSVQNPDNTLISYAYTQDTSSSEAYFTSTATQGTVASPNGVALKSTRVIKIENRQGLVVKEEKQVYTGSGYETLNVAEVVYDADGNVTQRKKDGRVVYDAVYTNGLLTAGTDESGIETTYAHNEMDEVTTQTTRGITTTYTRALGGIDCNCDGSLVTTQSAGGLALSSSVVNDRLGRIVHDTDTAGLVTSYAYTDNGRTTTILKPNTATEIRETYLDGQTKSITGTGVVAQYHTYGINSDGTQWSQVNQVSASGPRWTKDTNDFLGRNKKSERPGFGEGTVITDTFNYNALGQLVSQSMATSGNADIPAATGTQTIAYTYDVLGNQTASTTSYSGQTTSPVTSISEQGYADENGVWFLTNKTSIQYNDENGQQQTVIMGLEKEQTTGLETGVIAYRENYAPPFINGTSANKTTETTTLNRTTKTLVSTTTLPTSTQAAIQTTTDGLLVSSDSPNHGGTTLYQYDALGRKTGQKEPRHTNYSTITYNTLGQVSAITDAAGNSTTYTYYANATVGAGQLRQETNALGNIIFHQYDSHGRETYTWGNATYPVAQGYDAYGQRNLLRTYRDVTADFSGATFPTIATADTTTWNYDPATGALLQKLYADNKGPTYTYYADGLLKTRAWARKDANNNPLVTTYTYTAQGQLANIDYSDTTPDVIYTYNVLGQQATVTDGSGTRTYTYNPATQLLTQEVFSGTVNGTLNRSYDIYNRPTGYVLLDSETPANPTAHTAATHTYDTKGNFSQVLGDTVPAALSTGVVVSSLTPSTFTYTRLANRDLISTVTSPVHTVTNTYEINRDNLTSKQNKVTVGVNANTIASQYDYTINALGQRTTRVQSGTAFATTSADTFTYNSRNEVTSSSNNQNTNKNRAYAYDPIGNRHAATEGLSTTPAKSQTYTSNQLNQYTAIQTTIPTPPATAILTYDDDGNMLTDGTGKTHAWDCENRLIQVTLPNNEIVKYDYDGSSRRVKREHVSATQTNTTIYLYDIWNVIYELNQKSEILDNATVTTLALKTYIWGIDLSNTLQGAGGIGGLLVLNAHVGDSIHAYFHTYDANGNTSELIKTTGEISAHYEYDAFGKEITATGDFSTSNNYRFNTKSLDNESNLYYYGYRCYEPLWGRWICRDPILDSGFDLLSNNAGKSLKHTREEHLALVEPNRSLFVMNDPISNADTLGLDITLETGNIGGGPINNMVHQQICVERWKAKKGCNEINKRKCCYDGKICFSFGFIGLQPPQFSSTWLGWDSWVVGAILEGMIYRWPPVSNATIVNTHTTTMTQDGRWQIYMNGRTGTKDGYSVARHNCRTFSQWEFRDAPLHW